MYVHYAFHARGLLTPLDDHERCAWLWRALERGFPTALGAALMVDHGHLIAQAQRERRLAALLGAFSRRFGLGQLWLPIDDAPRLTSPDKRQRSVRYVSLNPARPTKLRGERLQLVTDPLEWPWTTHRDVVGVIAEPWVSAARLAGALGWERQDFRERWHRHVTRDRWMSRDGTRLPTAALPSPIRTYELGDIASAACAAHRADAHALTVRGPVRTTFVALAYHCGWRDPAALAAVCRLHPQSARRAARSCPRAWLDAAARCLADPRVIAPTNRWALNVSNPRIQTATMGCSGSSASLAHIRG